MDSKVYRQKIEHFMEEKGLKSCIFELFETETVGKKIKDKYDLWSSKVQEWIDKAPKEQAENSAELKEIMQKYTYDLLLDNVRMIFMARQYQALQFVITYFNNDEIANDIINKIKETISSSNESTLKDVDACIRECFNEILMESIAILYEGYVPKGIPKELIPLIQIIAGSNVIIPADVIFDVNKSEDTNTETTSDNSEGNKNSEENKE